MQKVAVIGAGIGGIAAALRLRVKGYEVDVYEQYDQPGGKLMEFYQQGFRFDMGPSLFTMPGFVNELFELFGEDPSKRFHYQALENTCNYYFSDGSIIKAFQDEKRFAEQLSQADRQALQQYLSNARDLFQSTADLFLFNPFPSKDAFLSDQGKRIGKHPGMLDAFKTLHKRNESVFQDQRLIQLFDRYATYNGSNPFKTPATLKMIAHLEHNIGAFFPQGGMYDIVKSLVQLAEEQGVSFHYNNQVQSVSHHRPGAIELAVNDRLLNYDLLINDVDVYTFYDKILSGGSVPRSVKWQQRSTSALIFYWGARLSSPQLDVHNILFAKNYQAEFKDLFKHKRIHDDPTVYIFISSKIVPSDAPDGMENWFVMVNTPENTGQDWDVMIEEARTNILKKIKETIGIDLEKDIQFEKMVDPREIEQRTGSYRGSLYGTSSNNRFAAFLRHPNKKNKLQGIYFVGGSVHPGGGIPLCLASAKIVANQIPDSYDPA